MTKTRRSLGLATLLLVLWPALVPAAGPATEAGPKPRRAVVDDTANARVIVKYRSGSGLMRVAAAGATLQPLHAQAMGARLGLALQDGRVLGERTQALRAPGIASADLAQRLAAQPDVEWVVVDRRRSISAATPNDPYYGPGQTSITPTAGQWYLRAPDSTLVSAINAVGAWATSTGSSAITVAVIDTGVRFDHPDLAGKLYPGYDFVSSTDNNPDDRDADASDPGDWDPGCGSPTSSWHGTQVSGLIAAASNNGIGMAGSGRDVMLLPVRALGKCGGYDSDIIAGMRWAGGITNLPVANPHPAQVINMSLGSTGVCEQSYVDAIADLTAAKVSVVVAAGNETGAAVGTPANCPGAIAVAGVRHAGTKVGYSNLGPEVVVSAPAGNCVNLNGNCLYPLLTTINLGATTPGANGYSDGTNSSLGTSFSAPLVAGTVALMLSVDNTLTPARIRSILKATARAFPTSIDVGACRAPTSADQIECYCTTSTCGAGMLDTAAAVTAVAPGGLVPPTIRIASSVASPLVGSNFVLNAGASSADDGRTIVSYRWVLTAGAARAAWVGATSGTSATLVVTGVGDITAQLSTTDSAGATSTSSLTLFAQAAPVVAPPPPPDSGGGGGASSALWLALLALASFSLRCEGSARTRR